MNQFRTGLLIAALTALFGGIGYLIGGPTGMVIALGVAAATNASAVRDRCHFMRRSPMPAPSRR